MYTLTGVAQLWQREFIVPSVHVLVGQETEIVG